MLKTVAAAVVTAAIVLLAVAPGGSAAGTPNPTPACPRPLYGADGTMGPLFCVIDNPLALRYYARVGRHTFALGPDASPPAVVSALEADLKHGGTIPITCSVYRLAAWRNQWNFRAVSVVAEVAADLHLIPDWCSTPHFPQEN